VVRPSFISTSRTPTLPRRAALRVAAFALVALAATACGGSDTFTWYTKFPRAEWGSEANQYVIGAGDVLNISVYGQQELNNAHAKVRRDGRIALVLLGEIEVAGKRPALLARDLELRYSRFIVSPRVTVNVEESKPITVSLLGEVGKKGTLTLEPPSGILQALAEAGGLTEFANDSKIYVLRQFPEFRRIRFTYQAIVHNDFGAAMFPLRQGDVIIVE